MKYRAHAFVVVRVPFDIEADSQADAVVAARMLVDESSHRHADAEYADEIVWFLIDEDGDTEFERSRSYNGDGTEIVPEIEGDAKHE